MARVRGPLLSVDAAGQVGPDLRFRHNAAGVHVYVGGNPGSRERRAAPSARQLEVRASYREANAFWRAQSPEERAQWRDLANTSTRNLSGWNLFLRAWMANPLNRVSHALLIDTATLLLLEDASGVLLLEGEG